MNNSGVSADFFNLMNRKDNSFIDLSVSKHRIRTNDNTIKSLEEKNTAYHSQNISNQNQIQKLKQEIENNWSKIDDNKKTIHELKEENKTMNVQVCDTLKNRQKYYYVIRCSTKLGTTTLMGLFSTPEFAES